MSGFIVNWRGYPVLKGPVSLCLPFFKENQKYGHVFKIFLFSNVINYLPKEVHSRGIHVGECVACPDQTKVMVRITALQSHLSPMSLEHELK